MGVAHDILQRDFVRDVLWRPKGASSGVEKFRRVLTRSPPLHRFKIRKLLLDHLYIYMWLPKIKRSWLMTFEKVAGSHTLDRPPLQESVDSLVTSSLHVLMLAGKPSFFGRSCRIHGTRLRPGTSATSMGTARRNPSTWRLRVLRVSEGDDWIHEQHDVQASARRYAYSLRADSCGSLNYATVSSWRVLE